MPDPMQSVRVDIERSKMRNAQKKSSQSYNKRRNERYPDLTSEFIEVIKKSGERSCNCDNDGPRPVKKPASVVHPDDPDYKIVPRCPTCGGNFYKDRDFSMVVLIIGGFGSGKTSLGSSIMHMVYENDPWRRIGTLFQPDQVYRMIRNIDFCGLHKTICERAYGLLEFDANGTAVWYYDTNGELVRGYPEWLCGRKVRLCQRDTESVEECALCPHYVTYRDRVVSINEPEGIDFNDFIFFDEAGHGGSSREANKVLLRVLGKTIRVVRHIRGFFVIMIQDFELMAGLRKAANFVVIRSLSTEMLEEYRNKYIIKYNRWMIMNLQKGEGILISQTRIGAGAWNTGIIRTFVPQIFTEDMSQAYAYEKNYMTEGTQDVNRIKTALTICEELASEGVEIGNEAADRLALTGIIADFYTGSVRIDSKLISLVIQNSFSRARLRPLYDRALQLHGIEHLKRPEWGVGDGEIPSNMDSEDLIDYIVSKCPTVEEREYFDMFQAWCAGTPESMDLAAEIAETHNIDIRKSVHRIGRALQNYFLRLLKCYGESVSDRTVYRKLGVPYEHWVMFRRYCNRQNIRDVFDDYAKSEQITIVKAIGKSLIRSIQRYLSIRPDDETALSVSEASDDELTQDEIDDNSDYYLEMLDASQEEQEMSATEASRCARKTGDEGEEAVRRAWNDAGDISFGCIGSGGMQGSRISSDSMRIYKTGHGVTMSQVQIKSVKTSSKKHKATFGPLSFNTEIVMTRKLRKMSEEDPVHCPHCNSIVPDVILIGDPGLVALPGKRAERMISTAIQVEDNRKTLVADFASNTITRQEPNIDRIRDVRKLEFMNSNLEVIEEDDAIVSDET